MADSTRYTIDKESGMAAVRFTAYGEEHPEAELFEIDYIESEADETIRRDIAYFLEIPVEAITVIGA
jgi:hypothetical protein